MEKLSEQLDEVILDIFQVLQDLYQKQSELSQVLKDGFFTMARARYNMGVKRVTADQIVDANLIASQFVELNECASGDNDEDSEKQQSVFVLCNDKGSDDSTSKISRTSDGNVLKKESDTTLRKRGAGLPSTDLGLDKEFQDCLKLIDGEDDSGKTIKRINPINLFGVLVPQALRSSQKSFEKAVSLSVDVANKKHKLQTLQKKLVDLKQEKSKLHSVASKECVNNEP